MGILAPEVEEKKNLELGERSHMVGRIVSNSSWHSKGKFNFPKDSRFLSAR
jgi:hypothetical protein